MDELRDAVKGLKTLPQDGEERWNKVHAAKHQSHITKENPGALSGSPPTEVLNHHQLIQHIRPGLTVLDIGVGMGGMSKYLKEADCIVDALDVATEAGKTVEQYARQFYSARRISDLPTEEYDLAFSMIVSQHMSDENLREQIEHVYRALKPGGIFSLHLAGATEEDQNNIQGPIPLGKDGAMCRTPNYSLALIKEVLQGANYSTKLLNHRVSFPQFKSYWYFVHIVKE